MQSARIAKTSPSVSSTCTIGGGDPLNLWKTPKNYAVKRTAGLLRRPSAHLGCLHSQRGGRYGAAG